MMFSKLSGSLRAAQMPSVTNPASTKGASVSSTSVARRKVIANNTVIASSAQRPACKNARTTVRLDS